MKNSVNMSWYKHADEIFKERVGEGPRDYCVYNWRFIEDPDNPGYPGEGKLDRPKTHKRTDLLNRTMKEHPMELYLLCSGLTKFEAQIYESKLIRDGALAYGLSKKGATEWDGHSMLNKQREISMEKYIDVYLK